MKTKSTHLLLTLLSAVTLTTALHASPLEVERDDALIEASEEDSEEWALGGSISLRYLSKQITYGLIDNPSGIVRPCAELTYGNEAFFTLAAGVEAYIDTTNYGKKGGEYTNRRWRHQELDFYFYLSKTWATEDLIGSTLETSLSYIYEYHPRSMRKVAGSSYGNTQWLYLEVSAGDYLLVPKLTLEYNIDDHQETQGGIYATFDLSHEFDLSHMLGQDQGFLTLTPNVGLGVANKERNQGDFENNQRLMLRDAYASIDLKLSPCEGFAITPTLGCHQQIDHDAREATGDDQFVAYFGIGLSYEF